MKKLVDAFCITVWLGPSIAFLLISGLVGCGTSSLTNPSWVNQVGPISQDMACWGSAAGAAVQTALATKGDTSSSVYKNAEAVTAGLAALCPSTTGGKPAASAAASKGAT